MEPVFPKRPQRASGSQLAKPMKLYSNYYGLQFTDKTIQGISKYQVSFEPEVPDNSSKLRKDIYKLVRQQLTAQLEHCLFWGSCLFSWKRIQDVTPVTAELDGVKYTLKAQWVQFVDIKERDYLIFLKIYFNSMMRQLRFEQIGPKSFNSKAPHKLDAHKIQVWPGFDARLIMKESGTLLNIDVAFRVVRNDSALDFIKQVTEEAEKKNNDVRQEIQDALIGSTVVTRYNNKTYRVEAIDFEKTPESTFEKDGNPIAFKDYFKTQYNEVVSDLGQPLLIHRDRKTGREAILVPELCKMTGLNDAMRADFRLMKDLAQITHTDAQRKANECRNLLESFKKNEKCRKMIDEWKMEFQEVPVSLEGYKYNPGNLLMGQKSGGSRVSFDIEATGRDIDRKIQDVMYDQPEIRKWAIFHGDRDQKTATEFESTMQKCLE